MALRVAPSEVELLLAVEDLARNLARTPSTLVESQSCSECVVELEGRLDQVDEGLDRGA